MELTYPSLLSPAPPAFRLSLPESWQERAHASASAFAVDTHSPADFTVNLVVLSSRVLTEASLDELFEAAAESNKTNMLEPQLHGRRHETIDGRDAVLSAVTFRSEKLPFPLFQTQAALLVGQGTKHLLHCYSTCPAAFADDYAVTFRAIFASLHVTV
ncbi:DcrB-related protein [Dactylosporangium sp. NPDC051484]|uniref:DcrB-related protein n=1 Tax=Dactylosporangium sp. NPDC051484 TaxID=3154942 RepID=UPI00344E5E15